jgi:HK97 family phage prohead protease
MSRAATSAGELTGIAVVYGAKDEIAGSFYEVWLHGAFARSLRSGGYRGDVLALWSHNSDLVLGRRSAGTLSLKDKLDGLHFTVDLPDTQLGRDARTSVRRGDVNGVSFAFQVASGGDRWSRDVDGRDLRVVHEAQLIEVSPVAFPAFRATSIGVTRGDSRTAEALRAQRHALRATEVYGSLRDDPRARARHPEAYRPSRRTVPATLRLAA